MSECVFPAERYAAQVLINAVTGEVKFRKKHMSG